MSRLFGTDGVRGEANSFLTPELAFHLGRAAAAYFGRHKKAPVFLIGRDTRISGAMLEHALAAGICSAGGHVVSAGVIPTPGVAYLVRKHGWEAGVVISASHNPFPDNGIKFFDGNGFKLTDEIEDELERLCLRPDTGDIPSPTGADIGRIESRHDLVNEYVDFIVSTVDVRFDGLTIVYDGANGAAYEAGPAVLRRLGASVVVTHSSPDGTNINDGCGSTHLESLQDIVRKVGADAGIANDGDADRCLMTDETGEILDGDRIMLLCAMHLKEHGRLRKDTVVATVMSNLGFHRAAASYGIETVSTAVGDRYVLERMRTEGFSLGGEQSGHLIFLDYNSTGDGLLTAVQTLAVMKEKSLPLSKLAALMTQYPQLLVNVRVQTKFGWDTNPLIAAAISEAERELGEDGRILVRPSGTEPLIRVMAEGSNLERIERLCRTVADCIGREQGLAE